MAADPKRSSSLRLTVKCPADLLARIEANGQMQGFSSRPLPIGSVKAHQSKPLRSA